LFLDDGTADRNDLQLESIAHGVISLTRTLPDYGIARRQLEVQKIRGKSFREGHHDFMLRQGGMVVFPRLVAAEHHTEYKMESVPSGLESLDALVGGGLDRGTSTMLMGAPGTGKSTLALHFAMAAAERGEKCQIFIFDETVKNLVGRTAKLGMQMQPHIDTGAIVVRQIDPAEISPGELAYTIAQSVSHEGVKLLIIDSINGYLNAMPAERYLNLQLHELLAFLNQQGVLTIMVLAQQGIMGTQSAVDLTYLSDTVIRLQYFEERGAVKQALSVIKKRTGNHERTLREIWIGSRGIEVGQPLVHLQGVLTGVPTTIHESGDNSPVARKVA
jgi:circadian clock protein KaiC